MALDLKPLKLKSPCGQGYLSFEWNESINNKLPSDSIMETIRWVCKEYSVLKSIIDIKVIRPIDRSNYDDMQALCGRFNHVIDTFLSMSKGTSMVCGNPVASSELLKWILEFVYMRAIPQPFLLNKCKPNALPETYGETNYEQVKKIIQKLNVQPDDTFIDLGSGIGHIVLQVAASTPCRTCVGIEKENTRAHYANQMDKHFTVVMKWFGKKFHNYQLIKGDFLDSEYHHDLIYQSTIIFVNNFAFRDVNHKLKALFGNLENNTRIVSTYPFRTESFRISDRNLDDPAAIMRVSKYMSDDGAFSWTQNPVPYYIQIIDRSLLQEYFDNLNNQDSIKNPQHQQHHHKHRRRSRDLLSTSQQQQQQPRLPNGDAVGRRRGSGSYGSSSSVSSLASASAPAPSGKSVPPHSSAGTGTGSKKLLLKAEFFPDTLSDSSSSSSSSNASSLNKTLPLLPLTKNHNATAVNKNNKNVSHQVKNNSSSLFVVKKDTTTTANVKENIARGNKGSSKLVNSQHPQLTNSSIANKSNHKYLAAKKIHPAATSSSTAVSVGVGGGGGPPSKKATTSGLGSAGQTSSTTLISKPFYTSSSSLSSMGSPPRTPSAAAHHNTDPFIHLATTSASTDPFHKVSITSAAGGTSIEISSQQLLNKSSGSNNNCMLSNNKKLKREHAIISPSQSDEEKKLIHSSKKLIKNTAMTTTGLLAQIKPLLVERQVSTKKTSATNPDIFNHASSSTTKRKLSPPPPVKSANAPRTSAPLTQQINGPPRTSKIDYGPPSSDEDIFSSSHHPSKIKIAVTTAGAALDTKMNANKLGKSSQLLPIFLPEGTRVLTLTDGTRKAKVRKLGLELRVRVRLKDNKFVSLGQDQINGTVEVGALVEILKAGDHFASKGTIDKITDRTSYTLEFGNGETKIVKRNQIKQILHLGLRNYSKFMGSTDTSTADKQRSTSPPLPSFLFAGVGTTGTVKITHPSPLPPATTSKVTAGISKIKSTAASTDFGGLQTAPPPPLSPFTPSNHSSSTTATSSTPSSPQHEGLLEELPLGSSSASQRNNRAVSSPQKFVSLNGLVSQQQLPPTTVPAGLLSKRKRGTIDFESSLDLLHQHTVNSIHRSAISSTHNNCNDYYTGSLTGTCGVVRSQPSSFSSQYRTQNQTGMVASLVFTKPQTVSTSSFRHIKDTLMKVFYQICALETKMNLPTVPANDDDSAAPHGSVDGTTVSDASLDSKFLAKIQGQTLAQLSVNQTMAVKLSLAEQAKRDIILDISKLLQHKMNKLDSSITKPMNLSHFAKNVVNLQQNLKSSIVKADSEIEYLSAKNRELKDRLTEFSKILTPPNAGAAVGSALLANFVSPTFQPHHHHQHQNLTQMTNQAAGVKAAKNISATFLIPPPPLVNNPTNFKSSLPLVNNSNYSSPLLLAHSTPAPVSYAANLTVTENTVTVSPLLRVNCGAGGIRRQLPAVVVAPPLPNSTPKFPSLVAAPATPITNLQPLKTFVNTAGGATSSHHNNSLSLGNTQQTFSTNSSILLAPNATIPSSQHHQHQQQALFSKLILEYQQHLARQFGPTPALNNPNPSIANSNSSFPFFNYNSVGAANYFNNFLYTTQPHTPSSGAPPPPPQIVPIRAAIIAAPSAASQLPYGGISTSAQQSRVTPSPAIVSATVTHTTSLASSGVATTLAALNLPTVDGNSTSAHCCSNNNHVTATPLVISVGSGCQVTELAAVDDDPVACATYVRNVIAKAMIESHLAALPSSATGSSTTSSPSSSSVTVVCTTNPKTPPTTTGVATVSAIKSFSLLTAETSYAHLPEAEGAASEMIISRSSQISKPEPAKSPSETTEVILPATLKFSNSAAAVANSCTPAVVIPKITTAVSPESPFTPTTHLSTTVITTIPILTTTPTQTHDRLQDTFSNTTNSLTTPPPPKFEDIKDNYRTENCEKLENSSAIPISQPDMIIEDTGSRLVDCSQAITTIGNEITKSAVMPADEDDQVKVVNPTTEARDDVLFTTKTSIESNETINITNTMNSSFEAAINTGTTGGTWTTLSTSSTVIGERFFKRSNKESRPSHKLVTVVSQQQLHGNNSAGGIAVSAPTTTITTYPHYHHHPILPSNNNDSRFHSINTSPTTTLISPIPKPIITTATTMPVASDLVVRPDTIFTDCGNVALTSPPVSVENSASLVTQAQLKPLHRGSVIVTVATAPILATISSHDTLDSTDVFNPPSVKEAEILPENERITPIPTPTTPPFSTTSKNNCCSERDKPLKKRNNNSSVSGGGSSSQTDRGGDYCNESNSSFNTASSPPPIPPTPPATVIPLASSSSSSTLKKCGSNKFLAEDPQTPLSLQHPPLPPPPSSQSSIIYNNNNNNFVVEDEELQNKKKSLIEQNIENAIDTVLANVNNNNYNWYKPAIASEFSSSVNSPYTDDYNLNRGGKTYSTSFSTACNNNSSNSPVSRLSSLPSPMFSSAASTSTIAAVANYYASSSSSSNSNNHQQHHTPLMITPPITTAGSGLGGHLSYRSSPAAPLSYHNQQPYLSYFMRPQHGTPASTGVSYAPLPSPPITMGMPAIFSPPPPQPRLPPRQSSHSAAAGGTPMGVNSWLSAVMAACVDTPLHTNVSGFPVPNHHQQQLQQQQPSSSSLSSLYQHAYHLQAAAAQRNFSGGPHSGRGPVNNVRSLSNPAAAAAFNGGTLHKNHHQSFVETSGSEYHHQQQQHSNYGTEHQSPHQQQPSYNAASHGSGTTGTVPNIQTLYSTPYYTAAHMNSSRAHYSSQLVNQQQQQLFTNSPPYYQGVHNHLQQQRQHQSPLISNYGYNSRSGSTSAAAAAIVPPSYVVPATNFSTVPQLPPSDQMSTNPTTFYNNHFNNPKMGIILGSGSSSLQNGGNSQTHPHPLYPQSIASPSFYPIPPSTPPTTTNTAPIRLNTAFFFPPAFPFPSPSTHGHVTSIPPVAATAQIAHNPNKSSLYHSSVSDTTHNDNGSSEEVTKPKNSQVVDMLLYSTTSNSGTDNVV